MVNPIRLDLGVRLLAQVVGVDKGEMPHVQKVLNTAQGRGMDAKAARMGEHPTWLIPVRQFNDVALGLSQADPDPAMPEFGVRYRLTAAGKHHLDAVIDQAHRERAVKQTGAQWRAGTYAIRRTQGLPIIPKGLVVARIHCSLPVERSSYDKRSQG